MVKNPPANAGDTSLMPEPGGSHVPRPCSERRAAVLTVTEASLRSGKGSAEPQINLKASKQAGRGKHYSNTFIPLTRMQMFLNASLGSLKYFSE